MFNDTYQSRQILDQMEITKADYENKLEIYSNDIEELREKYNDDLDVYNEGGCLDVIRSQTKYDLCIIMFDKMKMITK